jgi:hypothetical protein
LAKAIRRDTIQFFVLILGGAAAAHLMRWSFGQTPKRSRYLWLTHPDA